MRQIIYGQRQNVPSGAMQTSETGNRAETFDPWLVFTVVTVVSSSTTPQASIGVTKEWKSCTMTLVLLAGTLRWPDSPRAISSLGPDR
jgi:hypothetical protein